MRQVNTAVESAENRLDIAIEKPGTADKEVRYDVASVDLSGGDPVITSSKGKQFRLVAEVEGGERPEVDPWEVADHATDYLDYADLGKFLLGQPVELDGETYYSFAEWLQDNPIEDTERAEEDEEALAVVRVSPRLVAVLGFTPKAAYEA